MSKLSGSSLFTGVNAGVANSYAILSNLYSDGLTQKNLTKSLSNNSVLTSQYGTTFASYIAQKAVKKYGKVNLVPIAVDYLFLRDNRPEVWVEFGDVIELADDKINRKEYAEYLAETLENLCDNQLKNISHAKFSGYETLFQQKLKWYRAFEQHLKKIKETAKKNINK